MARCCSSIAWFWCVWVGRSAHRRCNFSAKRTCLSPDFGDCSLRPPSPPMPSQACCSSDWSLSELCGKRVRRAQQKSRKLVKKPIYLATHHYDGLHALIYLDVQRTPRLLLPPSLSSSLPRQVRPSILLVRQSCPVYTHSNSQPIAQKSRRGQR